MINFFVLARVTVQHVLVGGEKWSVGQALVPDERDPAARLQNALELLAGTRAIEPVESLSGDDQLYAVAIQGCCLGAGGDAGEALVRFQEIFTRSPHLWVRFNAKDAIAVLQKQFGKEAGAATDIGDDPFRAATTVSPQAVEHLRRIPGPVLHVIFNSLGKAFGRADGVSVHTRQQLALH